VNTRSWPGLISPTGKDGEADLVRHPALPSPPATSRTTTPRTGTPTKCSKSFREGTEAANEELRASMGVRALEIVGWAEKPLYTSDSHRRRPGHVLARQGRAGR